jgi:hypothetical protein
MVDSFADLGSSKAYVNGKVIRFDGCEKETWREIHVLAAPGLRIVDHDTNTLSMIVVVPKFQYFQLFMNHNDIANYL